MAQSFIPAGIDIVCTEMTSSSPAQLGISEREVKVLCNGGSKPALNAEDKKLSCSLQCRIKQSFFNGLGALLTGLACGALAVATVALVAAATVATGGAVLALAGVAALGISGALAVGGGVSLGVSAAYKYLANDCDCSLSGDWTLTHDMVKIQGHNALLQKSILKCSNGGILSIAMDSVKAEKVAENISKLNNEIMKKNLWSKFWQGLIGNGSNAILAWQSPTSSVTGLVLGSGLSIYDYCNNTEEYRDENMTKQQEYGQAILQNDYENLSSDNNWLTWGDVQDSAVSNVVDITVSGIIETQSAIAYNKVLMDEIRSLGDEALRYLAAGDCVMFEHASWAQDLAWESLSSNTKGFKDIAKGAFGGIWKGNNKWYTMGGIGIGLASSIVSNVIENEGNKDENQLYIALIEDINNMRVETTGNIGIISKNK